MNLSTVTAFVTGGNRGIGRAIVDRLLAEGAVRVYATARSAAEADKLSQIDRRVTGLVLDTTDGANVAAAAGKARDVTLLRGIARQMRWAARVAKSRTGSG